MMLVMVSVMRDNDGGLSRVLLQSPAVILESEMQGRRELLRQKAKTGYPRDAGHRFAFSEWSHQVEHRYSRIQVALVGTNSVSAPRVPNQA